MTKEEFRKLTEQTLILDGATVLCWVRVILPVP